MRELRINLMRYANMFQHGARSYRFLSRDLHRSLITPRALSSAPGASEQSVLQDVPQSLMHALSMYPKLAIVKVHINDAALQGCHAGCHARATFTW